MLYCQNRTQNEQNTARIRRWLCIDLPSTDYRQAWYLQSNIVTARKNKVINNNVILLLEHPSVFTLGRRGGLNNLSVPENFLEKAGIPVIQVERGGNITFHGLGQLVMYPIIDLQLARLTVTDYVENLEEVMIRTAADWGIKAARNSINRGVWVGNNKLGSIGIAIRRGICFHGMALNVNISLKPFAWIHPCGLQDAGVTSMAHELSRKISMKRVRETLKCHLEAVFGVTLNMTSLEELNLN
ncbi:MAG: lipoyl(octanoyl) transferase LipB [Proteobacteria bacterium]|nr:lipoyl(octanoyl) transferase LipB [Pseudomonadota bacterium]